MSFAHIAGHDRSLRVLRRTLQSARMPHAMLFWGPDGVGKETVAVAVAGVLLCRDPGAVAGAEACGRCTACHKMGAGQHPDLHLVTTTRASISVDDVRRLQETLAYQAFERGRKVAIIRDAFRLTREASNALLKTLEEPPDGTHIVLLTHHRNQLLPTLVSRCQALRFDPIPQQAVVDLLKARGVESMRAESLGRFSGGCPGAVVVEDADALLEEDADVRGLAERWGRLPTLERFGLAARWAGDKARLGMRLDSLERHLAAAARGNSGETVPAECAADALEGLFRVRRLLDQNVNPQLALEALFLGLAGVEWEDSL